MAETTTIRGSIYPRPGRLATAVLLSISAASLPVILLIALLANDPPVTSGDLVRLIRDFTVFPAGLAWCVQRACGGTITVGPDALVLERPFLRLEVPLSAIARPAPWLIPLPMPGITLVLRSGRRLRDGHLALRDPDALLAALGSGGIRSAHVARLHPCVRWAAARATHAPRGWRRLAARFPLFALPWTAILFYTHQHITYGGTFGEYYLRGAASFAQTFGIYWLTFTIYLVLYASIWRAGTEALTVLGTLAAPGRAAPLRQLAEWIGAVGYYGTVPALVLARYLA